MLYFARFCSVAGYNCTKLVGVSLYDLIHAADIGPVTAAFRNCECRYFRLSVYKLRCAVREHGQVSSPVYRLLCGGGGWVWVQTRAWLGAGRRGSCRPSLVTCATQQLTEVTHPGLVLATVQTEAAARTIEHEATSARSSWSSTSLSSVSSMPRSVIIEPRPSAATPAPAPQRTCYPTSVIVRRPDSAAAAGPSGRAATESLLSASGVEATLDTKPGTGSRFPRPDPLFSAATPEPRAVTETFFTAHKSGPSPSREADTVPNNMSEEEQDFFEELFSNLDQMDGLEQLAPHPGHRCVAGDYTCPRTPAAAQSASSTQTPSVCEEACCQGGSNNLQSHLQLESEAEDSCILCNTATFDPSRSLMMGSTVTPKKARLQCPGMGEEAGGWTQLFCYDTGPPSHHR